MPRCFLPPVGLWSRPHAKAAVLEDDGLVGHCIVWLWLQLAESVIDVEWSAWYLVLPASCRGMHLWISWQGTWWDTALFRSPAAQRRLPTSPSWRWVVVEEVVVEWFMTSDL